MVLVGNAAICSDRSLYYFSSANHAHVRIYINVAYSVPFRFPASSIVGLGLGLVVGLRSVLVYFFIAFSRFRCILKDRKLATGLTALVAQWTSSVFVLYSVRVQLPVCTVIFLRFFQSFFPHTSVTQGLG